MAALIVFEDRQRNHCSSEFLKWNLTGMEMPQVKLALRRDAVSLRPARTIHQQTRQKIPEYSLRKERK